jgi:O-antigen/teichoic acid export membrane protein
MYTPQLVGLSSAAISAMMLLGTISKVGLDTMLVGELPRNPQSRGTLISTALLVTGGVGTILGILFAYGTPFISPELTPLSKSITISLLFSIGVGLTSITLVVDQALIGLLRGQIQLQRNFVFAISKLLLLVSAGMLITSKFNLTIYATWVTGYLLSLGYIMVAGFSQLAGKRVSIMPQLKLLRELSGLTLRHYALNLALQVPGYTLPLLVAALISVENSGSFYLAWMIASFLFAVPYAFTRVLFAVGAGQQSLLKEKMRFTLKSSFIICALGAGALLLGANLIMSMFGSTYAAQATSVLRILSIGVFPIIIKTHFVAVSQIFGRMIKAAKIIAIGGVLELALAAMGAHMGGLIGLSLGWVIAVYVEGLMTMAPVYHIATSKEILHT